MEASSTTVLVEFQNASNLDHSNALLDPTEIYLTTSTETEMQSPTMEPSYGTIRDILENSRRPTTISRLLYSWSEWSSFLNVTTNTSSELIKRKTRFCLDSRQTQVQSSFCPGNDSEIAVWLKFIRQLQYWNTAREKCEHLGELILIYNSMKFRTQRSKFKK